MSEALNYQEMGINTANRGQLIVIVYEAVVKYLNELKNSLDNNDIDSQSKNTDMIFSLVGELRRSLDMEKGKEISETLDKLYAFILRRISSANIETKPDLLDVCIRIMTDLKDAWEVASDKEGALQKNVQALEENSNFTINV